jgi:ribosomal protein L30/L7E
MDMAEAKQNAPIAKMAEAKLGQPKTAVPASAKADKAQPRLATPPASGPVIAASTVKTGQAGQAARPAQVHSGPAKKASIAKPANPKGSTDATILLAVVRVRGMSGLHPKRKLTMEMLNIPRSNNGTLVISSGPYRGMLQEAKDYVAWGPISEKMVVELLVKRGTQSGNRLSTIKKPEEIVALAKSLFAGQSLKVLELDRTFRLTPPSGGWKDRKKTFPYGDLGSRPSMDDMIKAMI